MIRRSKYNAKKCEYEGMTFDSKKELKRYLQLKQMEDDGIISDLRRQVKFEVIPVQKERYEKVEHLKTKTKVTIKERVVEHPCCYIADFVYFDKDGNQVVEDVKSSRSAGAIDPTYKIKKKLMLYVYGIAIKEEI